MQVFSSLDDAQLDQYWLNQAVSSAWVTIGAFDGIHRGHQSLVRRLVQEAHAQGALALVLTFYPHPAVVLRGNTGRFYLVSLDERIEQLEALGVDGVVLLAFNRSLASQSAADFSQYLVKRLHMTDLLVGHDFAMGRNREGDYETLQRLGKELGFAVHQARAVRVGGHLVSSSRIRELLAQGNVHLARKLLGRPYSIAGPVINGDGRGHTIGIATANIALAEDRIVPAVGVYACKACTQGREENAVANLGVRPTFTDGAAETRLEAHLLDVHADLYGQTMRLAFLARLRDEVRFYSKEALLDQIGLDVAKARRLLRLR